MAGGHGQWFVQNFDEGHMPEDVIRSLPPEEALRGARHSTVAGNRARELAGLDEGRRIAIEVLPDARYVARLPESLLTDDIAPIYGRGPDARLTA